MAEAETTKKRRKNGVFPGSRNTVVISRHIPSKPLIIIIVTHGLRRVGTAFDVAPSHLCLFLLRDYNELLPLIGALGAAAFSNSIPLGLPAGREFQPCYGDILLVTDTSGRMVSSLKIKGVFLSSFRFSTGKHRQTQTYTAGQHDITQDASTPRYRSRYVEAGAWRVFTKNQYLSHFLQYL